MANLVGMNVTELLTLRSQIDERLIKVRAELEAQLSALGGKANGKRASLRGTKVPPKYRGSKGETWAGRGAKPRWLVEAMKKSGKKVEAYLIK